MARSRNHRQKTTVGTYDITVNGYTDASKNATPNVGDAAFIRSVFTGNTREGARAWTVTRVSPTGRTVTITAVSDPTVVVRMTRRYDGTFRYSTTDYVTFTAA